MTLLFGTSGNNKHNVLAIYLCLIFPFKGLKDYIYTRIRGRNWAEQKRKYKSKIETLNERKNCYSKSIRSRLAENDSNAFYLNMIDYLTFNIKQLVN